MTRASAWLISAALGIAVSIAGVVLLARLWTACEVGVNSSGNAFALLFFYGPALCLWTILTTVLVSTWTARLSMLWMSICVLLVELAGLWLFLIILHSPGGGYPSPVCIDNVPPWWPQWIPL
jgi:hypothetical protein